MPILKKKQEEESGEGAPLWIISFADMTSLLMAFLVMLSTFSSFGIEAAQELQGVCKKIVSSGGWSTLESYKAMLPQPQAMTTDNADKGSEKPTLSKVTGNKSLKQTSSKDYRTHKIFVIESSEIFWSKGTALTTQGRNFLRSLASFVTRVPSRIVISEYGSDNPQLGLQRAWAAAEYLKEAGISPDLCSISAQTMLAEQKFQDDRMLEITLVDKSIYK